MLRNSRVAVALIALWAAPALAADKPDVSEQTPAYSIEATLPSLGQGDRLLLAKLRADLMLELEAFRREAAAEKKLAAEQNYTFRSYDLNVGWGTELDAPRLLSLIKSYWSYRGGAHGNTTYMSLLFDRATGKVVDFIDLFGGNESEVRKVLRTYVTDDILRQKAKKAGKPVEEYDDAFVKDGVTGRFRVYTADPSTEPGKASGLRIWYAPYEVGAYVEGTHTAFVPHEIFSRFLTDEYKPVFAGQSARKPE
ncbi:MAG: DUF4163 domain-containing protein [Pseudomonadota bacterium]